LVWFRFHKVESWVAVLAALGSVVTGRLAHLVAQIPHRSVVRNSFAELRPVRYGRMGTRMVWPGGKGTVASGESYESGNPS